MDVIREGMANGSALLIAGAILVPILAWFTQWLNYKLMPQAPSSNNGNKTANSMENSMKTMNTVMPVFSAFMCYHSPSVLVFTGSPVRSFEVYSRLSSTAICPRSTWMR